MAELATPKAKIDSLRSLMERMKPEMALALPKHMTADRMARVALTACLKNPRLLECDPASFAGALLVSSQIGLEPDGHDAHLVPFYNSNRKVFEVQLIPDYKGLAKLARNSGEIKTMDWREVRKGDRFSYQYGSKAELTHAPSDEPIHTKGEDGKWAERDITHCYAIAILDSGEVVFEVMRWEDVEWHRDRYSKAAGSGPWVTNRDAMGAKTCFRKLSKKLPRANAPLQRAVDLDERAEQGIPQELGAGVLSIAGDVVSPTTGNGSTKLDRATEELKARDAQAAGGPASDVGATVATTAEGSNAATTATSAPPANPAPPPGGIGGPGGQPSGNPGPVAAPAPGPAPAAAPASSLSAHDRHQRIDRINQLYVDLGLSGPADVGKRAWLWDRFVGKDVGPEVAPADKLDALIAELERQKGARKKK